MSCTKFTVNLLAVEPHSDLKWRYFKFLYLLDPVGEGDEKVGNIQMSSSTGLFYVDWEHVPGDDEFQWRSFDTYEKALKFIRSNILKWWQQYHTFEQEDAPADDNYWGDECLTASQRNSFMH
jgi:hypothetical protein